MFGFGKTDVLKLTHQLHMAVRNSKPDEVAHWLRKRADANLQVATSRYRGNAYHAFASVQHSSFDERDVEILRELGFTAANINLQNGDKQTPLHVAMAVPKKYRASAQIARALISRGADVHARDDDSRTPLLTLCSDRSSDEGVLSAVALVLLEQGARIDDKMQGGVTPLMLAAGGGHADLYAMLAQKGANIHAKDANGLRASDYARLGGHYALADHFKAREDATPETKPSFDSTVVPKVEWLKLDHDKVSRTTIEDPIRYKLTEIFNFRTATYTCITQNLYTKAEAVTVRTFDELGDNEMIMWARTALERKGGHVDDSRHGLRKGAVVKIAKPPAKDA